MSEVYQRLGRFAIDAFQLHKDPDALLPVFARCVVLRAEYELNIDRIQFIAYSPDFACSPQSMLLSDAPEYQLVLKEGQFCLVRPAENS